jgi:general secretion pathway protein M
MNMNALQPLLARLNHLPPRERTAALCLAALAIVLVVYLVIFMPLHKAVDARAARVTHKQQDFAWLQSVAGQVQAMGASQGAAGSSNESLVVLVDRTAREAGLGAALTGQTPNGDAGVRVRLESAGFDSIVQWLGNLHQQHAILIESASIDRTPKDGVVNASVVLNRPK